MDENPGKVITNFKLSSLFHKAWLQAMTPANVMAGFKKAGVFRFNRHAIPRPEDIICSKFYLLFYSFILENSAYYSHEIILLQTAKNRVLSMYRIMYGLRLGVYVKLRGVSQACYETG